MISNRKHITIYEHQSLRTDRGEIRLSSNQLEALQQFYGEQGVPYYNLIHNGVKFGEYVGVLQIGDTIIEVLPKADKSNDQNNWREVLIGMLGAVGIFNIHAPSASSLSLKPNSILDLYFEIFVKELEYLMHQGFVKKYRKREGNTYALKGNIQFSQHLNKNLIHKERFYNRFSVYDKNHKVHSILFKALKLLHRLNTNQSINSRIGSLLLDFPEVDNVKVTESLFSRLVLDRKTIAYQHALEISKLILLNYHPDLSSGRNDVLALMFDMNVLWEEFVYVSLRKYKPSGSTIAPQNIKDFWKPNKGKRSKMKPDIVLNKNKEDCIVLDTKWKNLNGFNPSPDDLRQLYVYSKYYKAKKVALVYPGPHSSLSGGTYFNIETGLVGNEECSVISVAVNNNIKLWQSSISNQIKKWSSIEEQSIKEQ